MSSNKLPSFVGINEKEGTYTVVFFTAWYTAGRCDECPRFQQEPLAPEKRRRVAYCECMEAEEPCEITGKRYPGEVNDNKT